MWIQSDANPPIYPTNKNINIYTLNTIELASDRIHCLNGSSNTNANGGSQNTPFPTFLVTSFHYFSILTCMSLHMYLQVAFLNYAVRTWTTVVNDVCPVLLFHMTENLALRSKCFPTSRTFLWFGIYNRTRYTYCSITIYYIRGLLYHT